MIDKVDVRIPAHANFRPELRFVGKEIAYAGLSSTVQRSRHYQGVADLRPFGIGAMVHAYFRRRGNPHHKLELFETGKRTLSQMADTVAEVFEVNPYELNLMRVDFAADMLGVSVYQARKVLRVKHKRSSSQRGELNYEIVGGRTIEYFRYGKSPNPFRVYDKVAECKARFSAQLKRVSPDAELLTFEQTFGFSEDIVLTRIERQTGAGRFPQGITTFGDLRKAAELNPFDNVEIIPEVSPTPDPRKYSESELLKLHGMKSLIETYGLQEARAILNRNGNAKRFMDVYADFETEARSAAVTAEAIVEAYRDSTRKQTIESALTSVGRTHSVGQS